MGSGKFESITRSLKKKSLSKGEPQFHGLSLKIERIQLFEYQMEILKNLTLSYIII